MKIKRPSRLRTLEAAMVMDPLSRLGLCMHKSSAFVFDLPGATLVFGTIQPVEDPGPCDSTVPFIHCWAEYRGHVFAPTSIEQAGGKLIAQHRQGYYDLNHVSDVHTLSRPALLQLDRQHGLKRHLKRDTPLKGTDSFGGVLLDAAGVAWKDYGDGGVVPPYVEGLKESA